VEVVISGEVLGGTKVLEEGNWHTDANGQMSATRDSLRLIIRKFDDCARYIIVRSGTEDRDIMLASGTS
jgi:hypothetical protein